MNLAIFVGAKKLQHSSARHHNLLCARGGEVSVGSRHDRRRLLKRQVVKHWHSLYTRGARCCSVEKLRSPEAAIGRPAGAFATAASTPLREPLGNLKAAERKCTKTTNSACIHPKRIYRR